MDLEKRKRTAKLWREKNKEKILQKKKEYYLKNKEKKKEYILQNKEKIKQYRKEYILQNKEKIKQYAKEYYLKNKEERKEYYLKNKEYIIRRDNKYQKERKKIDPVFKLIKTIRIRILHALKRNSKSNSTIKLLGCSVEECWKHLESKFQPGMTRENHGKWHIDHIIPCASFDLRCPVQQLTCFHYSNLQPLWAEQNLSKGAKLNYDNKME